MEKRFSVNGRRYSAYGRTLQQLAAQEQKKRNEIHMKTPAKKESITTDQYFETWIEGKKLSVKPSTIQVYTSCYELHIRPVIGALQLTEITRRHIIRIQSESREKLCPATCNSVLRVLKIMLNEAVVDRLISENPATGVKNIKVTEKAIETYHRALTTTEQRKFMNAAKGNFYYELLAFQLLTGMRLGEVGALYWSDIDEEKNVIHVRRTITRTEEGVFYIGDSPKSEASFRDIPMNDAIKALLRRQREKQGKLFQQKKPNRLSKLEKLCFTSSKGHMINHGAVNRNIRKILSGLREHGTVMEPFTSHALRDTFATRYIEQGGNPQTLKTILGHSSLSMTMDLYSHVLPNTRQEEMNRIVIEI